MAQPDLARGAEAPSTLPGCLRKFLVLTWGSQLPLQAASRKPGGGVREWGPGILTNSHQWGEDGDQERSKEHVHVAVEARQPPRARVPKAQHIGVTMVHLDVSILAVLCREGRAYLEEGAREGTGGRVRHSQAK